MKQTMFLGYYIVLQLLFYLQLKLHVHVEWLYFYISWLNSAVYVLCPIWLLAVVPLLRTLPVCY